MLASSALATNLYSSARVTSSSHPPSARKAWFSTDTFASIYSSFHRRSDSTRAFSASSSS